ncbi:MAG: 2-oxoacid:ferredoxin oxidoreductase subunit beta [Acidobacteriota bacterium]
MSEATTTPPPQAKLTKKDFESDQDVRWCPGCGDYAILAQVQKFMPELGIPRHQMVFVSGIGCSSRFPYYMNTYGFHGIHGRAPALATGIKLANPELNVWLVTGDGDGLSIGGNHLLHIIRRNVDVKILLFNNRIYGLTKGQYSPTSEMGKVTKSTPFGAVDWPVKPLCVALGAEVTFAARTVDRNLPHMEGILRKAAAHKGTAFVEIYQNCNIFNDGAFSYITEKDTKVETELVLEHGKPLVFGPVTNRRGIVMKNLRPQVVKIGDVPESELHVHDETNPAGAFLLANLEHPEFPVPVGVFLNTQRAVYEDALVAQERDIIGKRGAGDLQKLLRGQETWSVA